MMDWNLCPLCANNLQSRQRNWWTWPDEKPAMHLTEPHVETQEDTVLYLSSSLTHFDHLQMFFPLMKSWQLLLSLQNQMQRFSINSRAVNAADSARLIFERRWNVFKMQSEEKTAVRIKLIFFKVFLSFLSKNRKLDWTARISFLWPQLLTSHTLEKLTKLCTVYKCIYSNMTLIIKCYCRNWCTI